MATAQVEERESGVVAGPAPTQAARATEADAPAWERFLQARAREAGCRPLARWRDEEGL